MKKTLLVILLLSTILSIAQKKKKIPSKIKKSTKLLAPYITQNSNSQREKADTIYNWITHTIAYDYKKLNSDKPFDNEYGDKVLKRKKAICTGYSELMKAMLMEVGIESQVVYGYIPSTLKDSVILPTYDSHSWVALKLNNKWYLTDPTWDAGYVGSIPTNKIEKYKTLWKNLNEKYDKKDKKFETKLENSKKASKKKKFQKKLDKNDDKRTKAKESLERKELKAKDFTGKTGFVRSPSTDWYMIEADSFLLAHLPSNPMWQLKKDTISCLTFAQGKDSINAYVAEHQNGHYHFKDKIEDYQNLDLLEQLLWSAEDAYKFNPRNFHTKAINYYNYVNILTNKKVQKQVPDKYKITDYSELLPIVDTANTYAKLAIKGEKRSYKYKKKYYKALSKNDLSNNKAFRKSVKKGRKNNDKTIKNATKTIASLRKQNHSLEKKLAKLNKTSGTFKLESAAQYLNDSLNVILERINTNKKDWKTAIESIYLKSLINAILQNRYLVSIKNKYLAYKDYNLNKYINEIDLVIDSNTTKIQEIYSDSLPVEILKKDIYNNFKALTLFISNANLELTQLKSSGEINNLDQNINYFNQILVQNYDSLIQVNQEAVEHNVLLKHTLEKLNPYWKDISNAESEQEMIMELRYEYATDKTEHEIERQKTMFANLIAKTNLWKKEFKLKIKEEEN